MTSSASHQPTPVSSSPSAPRSSFQTPHMDTAMASTCCNTPTTASSAYAQQCASTHTNINTNSTSNTNIKSASSACYQPLISSSTATPTTSATDTCNPLRPLPPPSSTTCAPSSTSCCTATATATTTTTSSSSCSSSEECCADPSPSSSSGCSPSSLDSPPLLFAGLTLDEIECCIIESTLREGMNSTCCQDLIPSGTVLSSTGTLSFASGKRKTTCITNTSNSNSSETPFSITPTTLLPLLSPGLDGYTNIDTSSTTLYDSENRSTACCGKHVEILYRKSNSDMNDNDSRKRRCGSISENSIENCNSSRGSSCSPTTTSTTTKMVGMDSNVKVSDIICSDDSTIRDVQATLANNAPSAITTGTPKSMTRAMSAVPDLFSEQNVCPAPSDTERSTCCGGKAEEGRLGEGEGGRAESCLSRTTVGCTSSVTDVSTTPTIGTETRLTATKVSTTTNAIIPVTSTTLRCAPTVGSLSLTGSLTSAETVYCSQLQRAAVAPPGLGPGPGSRPAPGACAGGTGGASGGAGPMMASTVSQCECSSPPLGESRSLSCESLSRCRPRSAMTRAPNSQKRTSCTCNATIGCCNAGVARSPPPQKQPPPAQKQGQGQGQGPPPIPLGAPTLPNAIIDIINTTTTPITPPTTCSTSSSRSTTVSSSCCSSASPRSASSSCSSVSVDDSSSPSLSGRHPHPFSISSPSFAFLTHNNNSNNNNNNNSNNYNNNVNSNNNNNFNSNNNSFNSNNKSINSNNNNNNNYNNNNYNHNFNNNNNSNGINSNNNINSSINSHISNTKGAVPHISPYYLVPSPLSTSLPSLSPDSVMIDEDPLQLQSHAPYPYSQSLPQSQSHSQYHAAVDPRFRCLWSGCNAEVTSLTDLQNHLSNFHVPLQVHGNSHSHSNVPIFCQWNSCWTQYAHRDLLLWHLRTHFHLAPPHLSPAHAHFPTLQHLQQHHQPQQPRQHASFMELDLPGYPTTSSSSPSAMNSTVDNSPSMWGEDVSSPESLALQYSYIKQEEPSSHRLTAAQELLLQQTQHHPCLWRDCQESFTHFEALTSHLSEEHIGMGKSEYICEWAQCDRQGRGFGQRQKAMRHIQTHTGDKPFQCAVCQKRFSEANIMAQHMRTHTGEKPFKCSEPSCGRQFSISGALTIHRRVHTGEKPFKCKFEGCDKWFAESSNLTKHLRVHTGERPFQCPYMGCDKKFSRPDQVTRHKKTHLTDHERIAVLKAERAAEMRKMR